MTAAGRAASRTGLAVSKLGLIVMALLVGAAAGMGAALFRELKDRRNPAQSGDPAV